ncbi:MAG: ribose 5-phosphate isomerase B [Bacteroidetes bacterium GWE2_39_28]|nr:MAG: ribose 5-phosphate isomerase B [Bacteroidetes bacterium GWE2_39_28]OFY11696.1 MAG: ribose 5-phosphate isomerase B [Bacteroidetes bacterium GWF2_39_10]OFZ06674.1 MAG: ribose 5-phosphate isomerase B [Bacteroidetes bacterium RIFOXYB2_FULL_39_7]OFZ11584.1 MAG: ribose 5-phosphate isomerase B [Bacteroidetes bacterium RIFOXYC2_FULL_39_11]HCT94727.1 ribose 5-phosphate isomerase B [Rikenellaceae bacterium]
MKTIGIASDHAGFDLKKTISDYLINKGIEVTDMGTHSAESMDYPDVAHPLANSVEKREVEAGIAICGSGNGINMTVNKHQGIRAALCWTPELAKLAREHNDANILSLPARFINPETALEIVSIFISTPFEGGRHTSRVNKIGCL